MKEIGERVKERMLGAFCEADPRGLRLHSGYSHDVGSCRDSIAWIVSSLDVCFQSQPDVNGGIASTLL